MRSSARCIGRLLAVTVMIAGCQPGGGTPALASPQTPADESAAFESFVRTRPTPEAFRERYPAIQLVLPGTITTQEYRSDRSRFHASLDTDGHVVGGKFH